MGTAPPNGAGGGTHAPREAEALGQAAEDRPVCTKRSHVPVLTASGVRLFEL